MNINFSRQTGHGIKIAIIDSGCSTRQNSLNINSGINLCNVPNKVDFTDNIGHGTACAGIIFKKAPKAELVPVKISESELVTDIETLIKAIEWCRGNGINIINLSLGTTNCDGIERLEEICKRAREENIFIVAANTNSGENGYPAFFPSVFGVNGGIVRGTYDYYFDPKKSIQFIARGDRQRLLWKDGQKIFLGGTSFAAPHITAIISLILEAYPGISSNNLAKRLAENSVRQVPELVDGSKVYNIPGAAPLYKSDKILSQINIQNDISWIKKAAIFPYNKEMHSLLRYKDMLSFEISNVADVVGKRTIGKDCGEIIGAKTSNLVVKKTLSESTDDFDTIILGYLEEISRIKKRDMLHEMLEFALENKKMSIACLL
ncbi:S8 family serine peptidase [candidate division KSB1 bacterium]|nr:S8 family serine peptidase [candidate division KSB1 bacterium]